MTFNFWGQERRWTTWKELKEYLITSNAMRKAENFMEGMIAVTFICMTVLFFYFFLVVIAL